MGRILAIDYGKKRTGIAVTDPLRIIATALDTVASHEVFEFLKKYVAAENVDCFVVGLPLQTNGKPSESTKFVEPFVKKLAIQFPEIPIHRMDERYTTVMAHQIILASGINKKARQDKTLADKVSATIILQSYMQTI
jgi:putative holliday junction resolvase